VSHILLVLLFWQSSDFSPTEASPDFNQITSSELEAAKTNRESGIKGKNGLEINKSADQINCRIKVISA
jgi:hypothetical protein